MKYSFQALLLPLFGAALIPLSSCDDNVPTSHDDLQIMPLAIGNRWIAQVTELDSGGTEYTTSFDTIEIVAIRENPGGEPEVTYIDNRGWRHYYIGKELFRSSCDSVMEHPLPACGPVALYPAEVADTFATGPKAQVLLPDTGSGDPVIVTQVVATKVIAVDTSITVPAGTFSCYHYRPTIIEPANAALVFQFDSWYCPGTGLILFEKRGSDGSLLYRWELLRYWVE